MRTLLLLSLSGLCLFFFSCASTEKETPLKSRPNILWVIPDDMSANFSCYGETAIETPHVDQLASRGIQFNKAYVTSPVCSPCRSALITGMYQTSIGAHNHRSGRGEKKIHLAEEVKLIPQLFQEAGYYTSISAWPIKKDRLGKTDYNFEWDRSVYDGNDWAGRKEGQPFFAQIHTQGGKLRGKDATSWEKIIRDTKEKTGSNTSVEKVKLPPYYPNDPDLVQDWLAYLESARMTDEMLGEVIARLEQEGIRENTLIIFMTDHGISHARGKQFLYDEGLHVPLIIAGPGIKAGSIREDLVEHIDLAALSLAAAGIDIPKGMQARDIMAQDYRFRTEVFAARDRCDETVDHIRSLRTQEFKYIRNFLPNRPYLQPCAYKDAKSIMIALRKAHADGTLNPTQELLFQESRPEEELYDLNDDPFELNNLAENPTYKDKLMSFRSRLEVWMEETQDMGRSGESKEMYDSDMKVYTDRLHKRNPKQADVVEKNIALMKKWEAEGK